jgi:hypothetical protein
MFNLDESIERRRAMIECHFQHGVCVERRLMSWVLTLVDEKLGYWRRI